MRCHDGRDTGPHPAALLPGSNGNGADGMVGERPVLQVAMMEQRRGLVVLGPPPPWRWWWWSGGGAAGSGHWGGGRGHWHWPWFASPPFHHQRLQGQTNAGQGGRSGCAVVATVVVGEGDWVQAWRGRGVGSTWGGGSRGSSLIRPSAAAAGGE